MLLIVKFPLALMGPGSGPGCTPVFSQAHENFKFWISNDSLFLADLFGLNCYVFLTVGLIFNLLYQYTNLIKNKMLPMQSFVPTPSYQWSSLKFPKSIEICLRHLTPFRTLLHSLYCKYTKGREEANMNAHRLQLSCLQEMPQCRF